jgi:hypothetical protein
VSAVLEGGPGRQEPVAEHLIGGISLPASESVRQIARVRIVSYNIT